MSKENIALKEELQNYETQKHADKNCLKAMQELVDSLTQNKLNSTTIINELQNKICNLESAIKVLTEENAKYAQTDIANESLKRQIKRLTTENDEILKDFETLEKKFENVSKISLEHQKGLLLLEKSTEKIENENKLLKNEIQFSKKNYEETKKMLDIKENELKSYQIIQKELKTKENAEYKKLQDENNELKERKLKSDERIMLFKTKLKEFSGKLKQLKITRENLVEIVNEYSVTVPKWQLELSNVSKVFFEKVELYENKIAKMEIELAESKKMENINGICRLVLINIAHYYLTFYCMLYV